MLRENSFIQALHEFEHKYGNVTGMDMYDKRLVKFREKNIKKIDIADKIKAIRADFKSGMSRKKISKKYGISISAIYKYRDNGWKPDIKAKIL